MSAMITEAPAAVSTRHVSSPIPLAPPVTSARSPSKRKGVVMNSHSTTYPSFNGAYVPTTLRGSADLFHDHAKPRHHHLLPRLIPPPHVLVRIGIELVIGGIVEVRRNQQPGAFGHLDGLRPHRSRAAN